LLLYQLLANTNLGPNWTSVASVTADAGGTIQYVQPSATNSAQRFYRLAR
jgi:hypothetical protein